MGRVGVRFRRFWKELKRRHVLRVLVAYAAVAWVAVQIGEATFEPLGIPDPGLTILVVLAILGFPVAAMLGWFLDVVRESPAPPDDDDEESDPAASHGAALADDPHAARAPIVLDRLPAPPAPLVGRERELAAAARLVSRGDGRILTVLGPGGVGKTRLALDLARRLAPRFRNGVCFTPVGSARSADGLAPLLAEHLGLGVTAGEDAWAATLGFVREKELLLVVDNFEHLTEAGELLGELAKAAPGLFIIVTTRERLALQGEMVLRLQGLSCPDGAAGPPVDACDAVRLFVQSACRVDSSFALDQDSEPHVARICQLVEGLPLALELAGACIAVLSPAEIARELEQRHDVSIGSSRDAPERHRSLHAAFESSWALLDDAERRALRRLAVFPGGFSRTDADELGGADLAVLASLINKSLVRRGPGGRFEMLEIVRQLAEEKLAADPVEERSVRDLLAERATAILEELVRRSDGGESGVALMDAATEAETVRAGWSWSVQRHDQARLARAADGLYRLWEARGWIHEGRELFRSAAEAMAPDGPHPPRDPERRRLLGRLIARQGAFAELCDDFDQAGTLLQRARQLLRTDEDPAELAFALASLSFVARAEGRFEQGHALAQESLDLYRSAGDTLGMAGALNSLGVHHYLLGEYDEAKRCYRESLAAYRAGGEARAGWKPLNNLAGVAMAERDHAEARRLLEAALENQRARQSPRGVANALQNLGLVACRSGDYDQADRWVEEGNALARDMGFRGLVAHGLSTQGNIRMGRGDYAGALQAHHRAMRTACDVGDLPLALAVIIDLARLHADRGHRDQALRLLRIARNHPACDQDSRRDADTLRADLGDDPQPDDDLQPAHLDSHQLRDAVAEIIASSDPEFLDESERVVTK